MLFWISSHYVPRIGSHFNRNQSRLMRVVGLSDFHTHFISVWLAADIWESVQSCLSSFDCRGAKQVFYKLKAKVWQNSSQDISFQDPDGISCKNVTSNCHLSWYLTDDQGGGVLGGGGGGGGIRLVLQQNDTSEAVAIRIIHRFIGEVILKRASHYPAKIDLVCHLGDQPAIT